MNKIIHLFAKEPLNMFLFLSVTFVSHMFYFKPPYSCDFLLAEVTTMSIRVAKLTRHKDGGEEVRS